MNHFRNIINKELNCHISLKLIEDLDEAIENFTKAIQSNLEICSGNKDMTRCNSVHLMPKQKK